MHGRLTPSLCAALPLLLTACASARPETGPQTQFEPQPETQVQPSATGTQAQALSPPDDFQRLDDVVDLSSLASRGDTLAAWRSVVPDVEQVTIASSVDGDQQEALWLAPEGDRARPLLVALHSWSTNYLQYFSTPYGRWADQEGWAMVAPDFRGAFVRPEATGSHLAVQDVLDSVDWALARGGVDEDRVFVAGFSGGGMMSLLVAGRHPDRFAGAVSWVPVHDLTDWYAYNRDVRSDELYQQHIVASCGGDPTREPDARADCAQRSPATHLDAAREAELPVYLGHGLSDRTVPPDRAVRAFDQLADEDDRLGEEVRAAVAQGELPDDVPGGPAESFFAAEDPEVLLARRSGPVTLVLFEGDHDMVFHPGLQWMAALAERRDERASRPH